MKQWKKFVGFDTWDRSQIGKETANPGPIDNKSLLVGECVCVCARVCVHSLSVCVTCICVYCGVPILILQLHPKLLTVVTYRMLMNICHLTVCQIPASQF